MAGSVVQADQGNLLRSSKTKIAAITERVAGRVLREALSTPHVKDRLPCEQAQEDLPGAALGGYPGNFGRSGFM